MLKLRSVAVGEISVDLLVSLRKAPSMSGVMSIQEFTFNNNGV
jgi:hypothetical protein